MNARKGEGIYNVVVIGAGTAGLVAAAGTAGLGGRVALIERHKMGGDCLNFGCVPSKALISSARLLHAMRNAADWGIEPTRVESDFKRVFGRMRERRATIAPHDSQERFESLGVDVFRGESRFVSPRAVEVDGITLRGAHLVIATGTRPAVPPIEGLDRVRFFTNETIFDELEKLPERLLVLGGGPIGCELAQAFARFGSRVTLLQRGPHLLTKEDKDISAFARELLEAESIRVCTNAELRRAEPRGDGLAAAIRRGDTTSEEEFDALLIAAGRAPNVESLNLGAAGVKTSKRGIEVNNYLQTSQPHIYAAGDVTGHHLFTHMADYQARIVVRNILMPLQFLRQKANGSAVPWCTFLDPEIARVGLGEDDAKKRGIAYDLFEQSMSGVDRAVVENATAGRAKVLVRHGSDQILGATIVAEHAGDLLQPFVLAMRCGIGLGKIGSTIHPYPTFVEVGRKAADQFLKSRLTPLAKRLFTALYARQRAGAA